MSAAEESLEESCEETVVGRPKGLAKKPFHVSSPSLDAGEVTDRVTSFVGLSEPAAPHLRKAHSYAATRLRIVHSYAATRLRIAHSYAATRLRIVHSYAATRLRIVHSYAATRLRIAHSYAATRLRITHSYAATRLRITQLCSNSPQNNIAMQQLASE